jgi:AmmeMemoRadiSam system protein B
VYEEHSITDIVPFINHHLPTTQITPLIISATLTKDQAEILSSHLATLINQNTILIAAVDLSHYLKNSEAQLNDHLTLQLITNFNYPQLFSLGNDYLDSPPTIATLLATMQQLGKTNYQILHHTNSAELLNDYSIPTTSYLSIVFH